jgi:hypothetical protein
MKEEEKKDGGFMSTVSLLAAVGALCYVLYTMLFA